MTSAERDTLPNTVTSDDLENMLEHTFTNIGQATKDFKMQLRPREVGSIIHNANGVATVSGLPNVGSEELIHFRDGLLGIAFNIDEDEVGVVLLGDYWKLKAGDQVQRSGRVMDVPVGDALLGRVINPLGEPLDNAGPINGDIRLPIERPAPPIMDRAPVTTPLQTVVA